MNKNFDAVRYAIDVGRELIANFAGAGVNGGAKMYCCGGVKMYHWHGSSLSP